MTRWDRIAVVGWLLAGTASFLAGEHVTGALLFIAAGVWYR